jgi:hypothetical protein
MMKLRTRAARLRLPCAIVRARWAHTLSPLDTPMDRALPEAAWGSGIRLTAGTRVTTMDNGVRVASEESMEPVAVVGVGIDKGQLLESRAECTVGLSAMIRRLMLTQRGPELQARLEELGASVVRSESKTRDSIYVGAELLEPQAEPFLALLGESVAHPSYAQEVSVFSALSFQSCRCLEV